MAKNRLSVEDFYHQFHGHEHHNDPGDHVKPRWHEIDPKHRKAHKGFDFHAHAAKKKRRVKKKVHVSKNLDTMHYELTRNK